MKLVLITRGRLVPRQPRAIKSTTPTALHCCNIHHGWCVRWNFDTTPTALHIRIFVTANGLIGDAGVVYIKWKNDLRHFARWNDGDYTAMWIKSLRKMRWIVMGLLSDGYVICWYWRNGVGDNESPQREDCLQMKIMLAVNDTGVMLLLLLHSLL